MQIRETVEVVVVGAGWGGLLREHSLWQSLLH